MNKVETTQTIKEFLDYNSNDIVELKSNNSDLFNAFSGLLVAIDKKYGSGDLKANDFVEKKVEMVDITNIHELEKKFKKEPQIKNLPEPIRDLVYANQVKVGNKPNQDLQLASGMKSGNFKWSESNEGGAFWQRIGAGDFSVYYSNPKYIKQKDTPSKKATKERTIEEQKTAFLSDPRIFNLPKPLYDLAIENQIAQENPKDDEQIVDNDQDDGNFSWARTPQGEAFWSYVSEGLWDEPEVASVLKSVVKTKKTNKNEGDWVGVKDAIVGKRLTNASGEAILFKEFVSYDFTREKFTFKVTSTSGGVGEIWTLSAIKDLLGGKEVNGWKIGDVPVVKTKKSPLKSVQGTDVIFETAWSPSWKADGYRPSPKRSASKQADDGEFGMGWDGNWYEALPDKNGVRRWKKSPKSFNQIAKDVKNINNNDLYLYTDQLKYAMSQMSPSDDVYKELEADLKMANSLKR